ncbi:hypothetical protein chiPu_0005004 [Chiloscyllium punctatum]|uniref:Uncharacterized protein n=1 Tax=Chiloscyllium punctatum TaxID=137246 RepID=A0A401S863_CHIPU|nr:hypothetical protein [Chiloscyllium punctatum]
MLGETCTSLTFGLTNATEFEDIDKLKEERKATNLQPEADNYKCCMIYRHSIGTCMTNNEKPHLLMLPRSLYSNFCFCLLNNIVIVSANFVNCIFF